VLVIADIEQQTELLGKESVIVLESETEQRKGLDGRATADNHLCPSARDKVESGELLKYSDGIRRAQHRDRTRKAYAGRSRGRGGEDDGGRRIQEVLTVVFADSEGIESDLVGKLDLFDEVLQSLRRTDRPGAVGMRRSEAVDSDLHLGLERFRPQQRRPDPRPRAYVAPDRP